MNHTISLATTDRRRSLAFYRDGLGMEAFGPLADDGVPEPLQLRLGSNVSLMLTISTSGRLRSACRTTTWVGSRSCRQPR
jgi:catechol 2,3-dioxygenase-like lactoylglutathione lyase family enzyme